MKVLNLYAGIGGNRKFWKNVEVTAVEIEEKIANAYKDFFPEDKIIVGDAHSYLEKHFEEFDFIWSSPPCPSHSHIRKELAVEAKKQNEPIYPDMQLYEEILFLQGYYKGKWVVENVVSWYEPLIKPYHVGGHYFWSNFFIEPIKNKHREHHGLISDLEQRKGFNVSSYSFDKRAVLRNCVEPELGLHVFECALKERQQNLFASFCGKT